jgi:hypothetical protein
MNYGPHDFPVATRVAARIVSLPMYPQLKAEQQARVAEEVQAFTAGMSPAAETQQKPLRVSSRQPGMAASAIPSRS